MDAEIFKQTAIRDSLGNIVLLKRGNFITLCGKKLQIRRYGRDRELSWHELDEETCEYLQSILKFVSAEELGE